VKLICVRFALRGVQRTQMNVTKALGILKEQHKKKITHISVTKSARAALPKRLFVQHDGVSRRAAAQRRDTADNDAAVC
jgi:hypothetical protein